MINGLIVSVLKLTLYLDDMTLPLYKCCCSYVSPGPLIFVKLCLFCNSSFVLGHMFQSICHHPSIRETDKTVKCNFSLSLSLLLTQFQTQTGAASYMILTQVLSPLCMWPLLFSRQCFLSGQVSHSCPDSTQLRFGAFPLKSGIQRESSHALG